MIGDDAERSGASFAFFEFFFARKIDATELRGALHEWDKKISIVVGGDALEDGGDAFEAHTCVHARLGQRIVAEYSSQLWVERLYFHLIVLPEHEIPDVYAAAAIAPQSPIRLPAVSRGGAHI